MNTPAERFSEPLIKTKLSVPQLRANLVARPFLINRLAESAVSALTLVCAPAGYGKTTLLTNWIVDLKKAFKPDSPIVCWLSLDESDNDPYRFLSYLAASMEITGVGISADARSMLASYPPPPPQTILAVLINDLEKLSLPIFLVLDDYQFISNVAIHQRVAFLLDHLPPNFHLVIATRSDPPIPLSRLRARNQLTEIRADDLRFSGEEAADFLSRVMGLELTPQDIFRLEDRTEGWIAGLQMAALALKSLSLQKQTDLSFFVKNLSGSNRYILDYLVEEVLSHQPEEIQHFLLETSVLDNLSGALCDEVTGNLSKSSSLSSQQILEHLERANLFLIPLDSERIWYRYHHLFADLLSARLDQQDPKKIHELHSRASHWYEQNQRFPEAIEHALDCGEVEHACQLIEAQVPSMLGPIGIRRVLNWIHRLPAEMAQNHPWLCIAQAWAFVFSNEGDKAEQLLKNVEGNITREGSNILQRELYGQLAILQAAFLADIHDQTQQTIEKVQQALIYLPQTELINRTYAKYVLGRMYFLRGEFSLAIPVLKENISECIAALANNYLAPTLSTLSRVYRIEGRLRDANDLHQEWCAFIETRDPRRLPFAGGAFTGLADVLREWNRLEEAEEIAWHSLELSLPWENPSAICSCYTLLARIYLAQRKLAKAEEAIGSAIAAIQGRKPMAGVISELDNARVCFWVETGQIQKASHWELERNTSLPSAKTHLVNQELDEITLTRVLIAEGKPELALPGLMKLAEAAEMGGRFGCLMEIHILQALAFHLKRDPAQALKFLEKSLGLAEPEGYIRSFIDEGEPLRELLLTYSRSASLHHLPYAQKLLAAYCLPGQLAAPDARPSSLIEPLTPREIEVLQGMAEGFTNHQIAEKLFLAEGTVKFYVHAVLAKLGAHNRTSAILEAKKQNIL